MADPQVLLNVQMKSDFRKQLFLCERHWPTLTILNSDSFNVRTVKDCRACGACRKYDSRFSLKVWMEGMQRSARQFGEMRKYELLTRLRSSSGTSA